MYSSNGYYGNGCAQSCIGGGIGFFVFFVFLILISILVAFGILAKNEANKQGRSEIGWFFLGFFFLFNAFIALKVSKVADEEGHNIDLWSTFGIFFGFSAIVIFATGLNAENKSHDFDCWCLLGYFFGIFALLISCFLKPYEATKQHNAVASSMVSQKSSALQKTITQPIQRKIWICPKCGCKNIDAAKYCISCYTEKPKK